MQTKDELRAKVGIEPKDAPQSPATNGHDATVDTDRILSFQDILDAPDVGELRVLVPEWKGSVVVRGLSRDEFLKCKAAATDSRDKLDEAKFEKALLVASMVSPKLNANTVAQFYAKDVGAIGVIIKAIMKHLGADAESIKSNETGAAEPGEAV